MSATSDSLYLKTVKSYKQYMAKKRDHQTGKVSVKASWNLTLWRQIFFLILAHPVYKMWITQEPKKLALWNKRHFEEEKTDSVQHV